MSCQDPKKELPSNEDFFTTEAEEQAYDEWYRKNITQKLRNALGVGHFKIGDRHE